MQFKYSSILELAESETQNLNLGIPIRVHNNRELEDYGCIRAQHDWSKTIAPLGFYKGGLTPRLGFLSAVVPECLPDRLEFLAYVNEFEFIYDDMTDKLEDCQANAEADDRLAVFKMWQSAGSGGELPEYKSKKMELQARFIREAMAIDAEAATWTIKLWAGYVEHGAGRENQRGFATLEEYIEYRYHDIGTMIMLFEIAFGMSLKVPEKEHTLLVNLGRPAWIAVALTNDLFSYDKECRFADTTSPPTPHSELFSSLTILMRERAVDLETAKGLLRDEIRKYVGRYVRIVEESREREREGEWSVDLRRYLEALLYGISGNLAYSVDSPRYHLDKRYNARQLEWMANGVPSEPPVLGKGDGNMNGEDTTGEM